jgi:hypothetical protein
VNAEEDAELVRRVANAGLKRKDADAFVELGGFPDSCQLAVPLDAPTAIDEAQQVDDVAVILAARLTGNDDSPGAFHGVHEAEHSAPRDWGNLLFGIARLRGALKAFAL